MDLILDRTVTRIGDKGETGPPEPLAAYRTTPAYVLLGDPGAGKTTAFEKEKSRPGKPAEYVTARDFLTLDLARRPEWRTKTLFIDGLDEVRTGEADARTPFDAIRSRLDQLRPPGFRISCRDAEWLGDTDRERLSQVSPDGQIVILRLDPLGDDEVRRLAASLTGERDSKAFLGAADERRLQGLLRNPQNLDLLARIFRETGSLPESRLETFDQALPLLAQELNEEHRIGGPDIPLESILEAAGWLSAIHLLSGAAGHCLADHEVTEGSVPVSTYGPDVRHATEAALRTRLFAAEKGRGRLRPAHANFAAFLTARTLAGLVRNGLPKGRVLSLLAGDDGAPPSSLRTLVAWLAALSPQLREELIARDAVAVLMFGDIGKFEPPEKRQILEQLGRDSSRLDETHWPESALSGLGSFGMATALRDFLNAPMRDENSQRVAEVITEALRHSPPCRDLSDALLEIARDASRWFRVRRPALDAWIRSLPEDPSRDTRLRAVLNGIRDREIEDVGGDLLGTLLRELYPRTLEPSELWNHFDVPSDRLIGRFYMFWQELPENCPEGHLPAHLDHLSRGGEPERPESDLPRPRGLPVRFLARGLRASGAELETPRLMRWLRIGLTQWGDLRPQESAGAAAGDDVRQWLESRPDVQKLVIRAALRTNEFRNHHPEHVAHYVGQLLYGSRLPVDTGDWHLEEASTAEDDTLAAIHVRQFLTALADRPATVDASLSAAHDKLAGRPGTLRVLKAGLQTSISEDYLERRIGQQHPGAGRAKPDDRLAAAMRNEWADLLENRASPALLRYIAQKRYEDDGGAALQEALGGNKERIEVAVASLRRAPDRSDLPSAEEIARLVRHKRESLFLWPVLVGLSERQPADVLALDDGRLRTVLALRLVCPALAHAQEAGWYRRCVTERPDLVSEVLVLLGRALVQYGETSMPDLHSLVHDAAHQEVARRATLPLLRAFPVRAKAERLRLLNQLLWSGLRLPDSTALGTTIEEKLTSRSMTLDQRTCWLAAGLASGPTSFLPRIEQQITGSKQIARLAEFFSPSYPVERLMEKLDTAAVAFLIRTIGQMFEPIQEEGLITMRTDAADCVRGLIARLGASPDSNAATELNSLAANPKLAKWRWLIEQARKTQRVVRRDASYRPPTPTQVMEALRDGPPVSTLDLREIVADRLDNIGSRMRTTHENLWRHYWNEDSYGGPTEPKPENSCRDALLGSLQTALPVGCHVEPERQYAGNTRSDLTVASGDFRLPIEIKKADSRDLWKAASEQLLARYAKDPAAGGLGVYVVLWFGRERVRTAPTGRRPADPDELRRWLVESLVAEDRRRVAVVVMDVTPPPISREESRAETSTTAR